jgi:hypothetical protein
MYLSIGKEIQLSPTNREEHPALPDPVMAVPTMHEDYRIPVVHYSLIPDVDH